MLILPDVQLLKPCALRIALVHWADRTQRFLQELWIFWKKVQRMYKTHDLLWPSDDPNYPNGFFSKVWAGRGREYRHLVEPLDIANWCAKPGCYPLSMPACPLLPGKPSLQISKCASCAMAWSTRDSSGPAIWIKHELSAH